MHRPRAGRDGTAEKRQPSGCRFKEKVFFTMGCSKKLCLPGISPGQVYNVLGVLQLLLYAIPAQKCQQTLQKMATFFVHIAHLNGCSIS